MAQFNLQGRWTCPPENYEVNVVMTGADEFNIKAISVQLHQHWKAGHGEVFESGKVVATFSDPISDAVRHGSVASDQRTINWEDGKVWHRH